MNKKDIEFYEGCLLGGAIGDAIGAPIEFVQSIASIKSRCGRNGVSGYTEYEDDTGAFTDDTQMTLFTAEGILRAAHRALIKGITGAERRMVYHSYLRWLYTQGVEIDPAKIDGGECDINSGWLVKEKFLFQRRAPGNTCMDSLKSGVAGDIGIKTNESKGCGGVMRVAPAGLAYFDDGEKAFEMGARFAAITHSHPSGYLSAATFSAVIAGLARGEDLAGAVNDSMHILKKWDGHEETLWALERAVNWSMSEPAEPETLEKLGGGWVGEEALAISIFCALKFPADFKRGVLLSVCHGGDSDSTGSITGNMLGLINGRGAIPSEWIEKLRGREIVERMARDLHTLYKGDSYNQDEEWLSKYPPF